MDSAPLKGGFAMGSASLKGGFAMDSAPSKGGFTNGPVPRPQVSSPHSLFPPQSQFTVSSGQGGFTSSSEVFQRPSQYSSGEVKEFDSERNFIYSEHDALSEEQKAAFRATSFSLKSLPDLPPPKDLI